MSFCGLITLKHYAVLDPINTDTFRVIKCALLTNTALTGLIQHLILPKEPVKIVSVYLFEPNDVCHH